ncbi:MAG: hypothetical protein EHM46_06020 [Bacteroidetes bacterium]|nr:MAG: hypothetical protein EHM46_06020 [Bacteroidota bacterium]
MKRMHGFGGALVLLVMTIVPGELKALEQQSSSPFRAGGDLVSSYLWRGTKFGTGPAIQPYLEAGLGNFTLGSWGSYCFTTNEGAEADLYLSYASGFGLSIGLTDYYFPGTNYFDVSDSTGAHALEFNLGYEVAGLSLSANYFLNEAGGAGTAGGDMYFEAGYTFKYFGIFMGAGNGWHTTDGEFALCNVGVTASTELKITENFSLPLIGSVILNPDREQFHVVLGISF